MKANPGGQIAINFVIGRDEVISDIWDTIEQQSVVITAERRIGKTTIIKKMVGEATSGWKPVFRDLEQYHSAAEFTLSVYQDIEEFLSSKGKVSRVAKELFEKLGGTEVSGIVKLPQQSKKEWKEILTSSVQDLMKEWQDGDERLVFFWDELPFMLANIRDRESEATAMEVLDTLRALRQTHSNLRMVFTGSIGLHHVLSSLKEENYSNSPVNDMVKIDVDALESRYAVELALELIKGEKLDSNHPKKIAKTIAEEADNFPFYIHHIARALKRKGGTITDKTVKQTVSDQLVDGNDPWELEHYSDRVSTYYKNDAPQVFAILDHLSSSLDSDSTEGLLQVTKQNSDFSRDKLVNLIRLMERDHYLKKRIDGKIEFRFPLIRRWWRIYRGL